MLGVMTWGGDYQVRPYLLPCLAKVACGSFFCTPAAHSRDRSVRHESRFYVCRSWCFVAVAVATCATCFASSDRRARCTHTDGRQSRRMHTRVTNHAICTDSFCCLALRTLADPCPAKPPTARSPRRLRPSVVVSRAKRRRPIHGIHFNFIARLRKLMKTLMNGRDSNAWLGYLRI